jgi:hypothetical protein
MLKLGILISALLVSGSAFASLSTDLQVTCSSDGGYTECDTGVSIYDAHVIEIYSREKSDGYGACVFGSQWGTIGTKFWTNYGCSAEFAFSAVPTKRIPQPKPIPTPVPPQPVPEPLPNPQCKLTCEWNGRNWQPYSQEFMHFIGMSYYGFEDQAFCQDAVDMSDGQAVCNFDGYGFRPYMIGSNKSVGYSFRTLTECGDSIRH